MVQPSRAHTHHRAARRNPCGYHKPTSGITQQGILLFYSDNNIFKEPFSVLFQVVVSIPLGAVLAELGQSQDPPTPIPSCTNSAGRRALKGTQPVPVTQVSYLEQLRLFPPASLEALSLLIMRAKHLQLPLLGECGTSSFPEHGSSSWSYL